MTNDNDLLREFVRSGSESAFSDLVSRHLQLVYSAAFRQLEDHDLARDVAQSVFVDLARKAREQLAANKDHAMACSTILISASVRP